MGFVIPKPALYNSLAMLVALEFYEDIINE